MLFTLNSLVTGLALVASSVVANPLVKRSKNVDGVSSHSIIEIGDSAGLRIYYPSNDGIREISSVGAGFDGKDQKWNMDSFLKSKDFTVLPTESLSAIHTDGVGIEVYVFGSDNVLRSWVYDLKTRWTATQLYHSVPNRDAGRTLNAVTWTRNGVRHRSVFYHEGGWLKEITKGNDASSFQVNNIGPIAGDCVVTVTVEGPQNDVVKRVYTSGKIVMTFQNGGWDFTSIIKPSFLGTVSSVVKVSDKSLRFYVTGQNKILEYTINPGTPRTLDSHLGSNSRISAVARVKEGKNWIYLVHTGKDNHLSITIHKAGEWLKDSPIQVN